MRLGRIFDNLDSIRRGNSVNGIHVSRLAIEVNGNDRASSRSDRVFQTRWIKIISSLVRLDWNRSSSRIRNREPRSNICVGGNDDFIARTNLHCPEDQMNCLKTVAYANAMSDSAIGPKLRLKSFTFQHPV